MGSLMAVVVIAIATIMAIAVVVALCVGCYRAGWNAGAEDAWDRATDSVRGRRAFERDAVRTAETEARISTADFRGRWQGFDSEV